jgi:hypothetical protein
LSLKLTSFVARNKKNLSHPILKMDIKTLLIGTYQFVARNKKNLSHPILKMDIKTLLIGTYQ